MTKQAVGADKLAPPAGPFYPARTTISVAAGRGR
jgi:hypothetical protein